ncbi:hypothetical protein QD712_30200 [Streptomyces acidiscabies]|uniref:hypothetical protein n=1 Tax=Streptomyces acidiscabies TaxID=42234 RepID=UPI0030CDEE6F
MNRDALTGEPPASFGAHCCRCERWTLAPVICREIERMSGPGVTLYACPDCILVVGVGPASYDPVGREGLMPEDT